VAQIGDLASGGDLVDNLPEMVLAKVTGQGALGTMGEKAEFGTRNLECFDKANPNQFCLKFYDSAFPVPSCSA
jgi:hypothetical protein